MLPVAAQLDRHGCSDGSRINPLAQYELRLDDEGVGVAHGAHVTPHTRIRVKAGGRWAPAAVSERARAAREQVCGRR